MTTQPLNDDTLREKLLTLKRPAATELEHGKTLEVFTDDLLPLFHQYAAAYAESIIGQDEPGVTNIMIAMEHNHQRTLNNEKKGRL